jgi:hypothetical protein
MGSAPTKPTSPAARPKQQQSLRALINQSGQEAGFFGHLPFPLLPNTIQTIQHPSSHPTMMTRTCHPRKPSIHHPPSPTKVTVPYPRRANNAAHRGGGEWYPQSQRRPRQRHGTRVEGGRVEVGLPRVAENANRQRMVDRAIYLPPATRQHVPANRCRRRCGTLRPQNGTRQQTAGAVGDGRSLPRVGTKQQ